MSEREANEHLRCYADACQQGRIACPVPLACQVGEPSARSWLLSDLSILGIACLCIVGWIAGVFA